ncbi:MAG: tetratricopeptide repeat protein [Bacteroidetes bacterium]|nr:MAG: tetratricopeptide repeat protein [Bacteroidota bacterium]
MNKRFILPCILLILAVLSGCGVLSPLQRSNLMAVHHLIEAGNFEEAKEVVEEMIANDESSQWARTWSARGLLAQTAYVQGRRQNDKSKYELYPNQLYVAISSYETARRLDNSARLNRQLAPRYVQLSNEFKKKGERLFKEEKYAESLRAFEQALKINEGPVLNAPIDKELMFNTALAAYENGNQDKAITHLQTLHNERYSPNTTHLLFNLYLEKEDIVKAEEVLTEGIRDYEKNETLVMLLAELFFEQGNIEGAIEMLENAASENPSEFSFHFTMGLIYQKTEQYPLAIKAYKQAIEIAPDELEAYLNLATCYYNMGVEIEESTIQLQSNRRVIEKRDKSAAAFDSAVKWLDRAYEKRPDDPAHMLRLYQLYRALNVSEKARSIQRQFN